MSRHVTRMLAIVVVLGLLVAVVATWRRAPPEDRSGPNLPPPTANAAPAHSGERPNVVLVIGCTVRRDQVSPYGGHPATTPFLSELAANGVLFRDAISAAPWTRPASTAILTGRPFREVGMAEPDESYNMRQLAPALTTLAEVFRAAGYWTIGATANPNLNRVFGFHQGFARYHQSTNLWRFGMHKVPGALVVDRSLDEIDRRPARDAPLYFQVMLLDAHQPGRVEPEILALFGGDDVSVRVVEYRALLHRFDMGVRRLWTGLRARGFDDTNTIFMVVSDHGEGIRWPSNQGLGHGNFLVPAALEMTWLVRGRGVAAGTTVDGLASQVDIFPTMLGLAGLDGYDGPGRDWSSQVRRGGRTTRTRAYTETDFHQADKSAIFSDDRACEVTVHAEARDVSCFDRKADRFHREPLATPHVELVRELDVWRDAQLAAAEVWPWTSDAFPTHEERAMLEQLGYIEE